MYTALEIAKYTLNKCIDLNNPINNLQLQKILYYIQKEYVQKTGQILFIDCIAAWEHGPSVPNVYYEFRNYGINKILDRQKIKLKQSVKNIIDTVIAEKSAYSAWSLVEQTQSEMPWINAYKKNGKGCIIFKRQT